MVVGCVEIEPSGNPFAPAVPPRAAPLPAGPSSVDAAPPGAPGAPGAVGFDFEAEDRSTPATPSEPAPVDPLALQAKLLGVTPSAAAPAAPAVAPTPAPVWDPSVPVPGTGFGVRVVAVLLEVQPPRAILGMADGTEHVVTPGAMIPSEGLVVLAIGRDAVQIAKVSPSGYAAAVTTETVRALYPVVPGPSAP